jgi:hypothetical protein
MAFCSCSLAALVELVHHGHGLADDRLIAAVEPMFRLRLFDAQNRSTIAQTLPTGFPRLLSLTPHFIDSRAPLVCVVVMQSGRHLDISAVVVHFGLLQLQQSEKAIAALTRAQ